MLVPVDMQEGAGGEGVRLDLQTLLKVLDQQTTDEVTYQFSISIRFYVNMK